METGQGADGGTIGVGVGDVEFDDFVTEEFGSVCDAGGDGEWGIAGEGGGVDRRQNVPHLRRLWV